MYVCRYPENIDILFIEIDTRISSGRASFSKGKIEKYRLALVHWSINQYSPHLLCFITD